MQRVLEKVLSGVAVAAGWERMARANLTKLLDASHDSFDSSNSKFSKERAMSPKVLMGQFVLSCASLVLAHQSSDLITPMST